MSSAALFTQISSRSTISGVLARWMTHGSILLADTVALATAGTLAVLIRFAFHATFEPSDYLCFAPGVLLFLAVFAFAGLYPGVGTSPIEEFRLLLRASTVGFLALVGATFFLREGILASRIVFGLAWIFTIIMVPLSRRIVRGWCSSQAWWGVPTVILGEYDACKVMLELLQGHTRVGLRPVAVLTDRDIEHPESRCTAGLLWGPLSYTAAVAKHHQNCYAVLAMPTSGSERIRETFDQCADLFANVLLIPDLSGMKSLYVNAQDICGVLALRVDQRLTLGVSRIIKRSFDLAVAITFGLLVSPLLILLCLLIKATSTGTIFYGQRRIGRNGLPFRVWKFRSMCANADEVLAEHLATDPALRSEWKRDHKLKRDPRVTQVGRVLRKTSLDELPQLWNVITGEMSLVGPRPIIESEIVRYGRVYQQYCRVSPGVTGLWQISGRNNTTYELRTRIDDYYVRNWSLALDIYILFRTWKTLLFLEGAY